jgi:hypothetical protein
LLVSLFSEVGEEDPPADPDDFADFVRRLAGVLIEGYRPDWCKNITAVQISELTEMWKAKDAGTVKG